MNESRLAGKVGAFAVISLVLLAALLLSFSKGLHWFAHTYPLLLRATTVAGLKSGSLVMLSGVQIGTVAGADVAPDGRGVIIRLKVSQKYSIHSDARFVIEQMGFLGDQYIAIYPRENKGPLLQPSAVVTCEEPFNIQEVVRSTTGLIQRVDLTVSLLNDAIERLDRTVLSENTLTNLQFALDDFRTVSDQTLALANRINRLVQTNSAPVSAVVSNLVRSSASIDQLAIEVRQVVEANRGEVAALLKNLDSAGQRLDGLAQGLEAGQGLAGAMLTNEELKTNVLNTAAALASLTSNLNYFGIFYRPKHFKRPSTEQRPFVAPKYQP